MKRFSILFLLLQIAMPAVLFFNSTYAQDFDFQDPGLGFGDIVEEDPVSLESSFAITKGTNKGVLKIHADIAPNWHVYSRTQPAGGPMKTVITVVEDDKVKTVGEFSADKDPHVTEKDPVFGVRVEDFESEVTWSIPIRISEGVDPNKLEIEIKFRGQTCVTNPDGQTGECRQISENLVASFSGFITAANPNTKFQPEGSHVLLSGRLVGKKTGPIKPGSSVELQITAEPTDGYHIYGFSVMKPEDPDINPTMIGVTKSNGWKTGSPVSSIPPVTKIENEKEVTYHEQPVTWSIAVDIPSSAENKTYSLGGLFAFQTCTTRCDKPTALKFSVDVPLGMTAESFPVTFTESGSYASAVKEIEGIYKAATVSGGAWQGKSLAFVLPLAFLAGLILNIMPCVLPVIGLKIMSFVQQAGENKSRVLMLNLVFSLGLLSVFMLLATLAVFFGLGWGELYTWLSFKVVMISVVFIFGLSFFGVWEIPIPGFVGTSGSKVAEKEGLIGAFLKGILTTLLATPCAGPLLVPAVVWAIAQPPLVTYLVFLMLGLGMAAPYILIGIFPALASFLPKPGNWMVTFKHVMGFVLMGTVVFLLNAVSDKYMLSVLSLLVALGIACWWIGRTSLAAEFRDKAKAWTIGTIITLLGILFSFYFLIPQYELDWKLYSKVAVKEQIDQGGIVFVDFTADW